MFHRSWFAGAAILALSIASRAQSETFVQHYVDESHGDVVAVEEDWRLVVAEPDPNVIAPQITTTISPDRDLVGHYAIFNVNYQALEQFAPGGVQLQIWNGGTAITHFRLNPDDVLSTPNEEIVWTQRMEVGGGLKFEVINGESSTWSNFGGARPLADQVSSSLTNLNSYDPAISVRNSGVNFARNRVESLVLERVRLKTEHGSDITVNLDWSALHDEDPGDEE